MAWQDSVARGFGAIDNGARAIRDGFRGAWRQAGGPVESLLFALVIGLTGARVLIGGALQRTDALIAWIEKWAVAAGLLVMTLLAFNEYLQRELAPRLDTELGGLWAIDGQMNLALLMLIVVGFLGASLATRRDEHIAVDAVDRVLAPPAARFVKRLVMAAAAGLCGLFAHASWNAAFAYSKDAFEGVKVMGWMVPFINGICALLPGPHYGPGTPYKNVLAWEDSVFDAGGDPLDIAAFGYVEAGSPFPLWLPLLLIGGAFLLMSVRFAARVLSPPPPAVEVVITHGTRRPADVILAGAFPGALLALALGAWWGQGVLILISSILLVVLGAPLFVGVGVGTVASWMLLRGTGAESVVHDMFEATKKQELLAIPFFVLAGNLMTEGSIARRLIDIARVALAGLPGGLGAAAVISCAFFAAISGSSPVTVIAIGSILFPMLVAEGYSERYSMGVLTTAGGLGIIIPPSVPMLVYAIIVSGNPEVGTVDPTVLFKAGILPGLMIALVLIGYTFFIAWPRPDRPGVVSQLDLPEGVSRSSALAQAVVRGLPSLLLPVVVLGGIYGWLNLRWIGIDFRLTFTITEAAAVAVVYALFVELVINRELKLREIPRIFADSAVMMGSLFLVLVIAISLNRFFAFQQIPEAATEWMMEHVTSPFTFLIMVNLFLLALGCVMDILSAILIVAPLLAPIAASYGIHPIHFGIMFIVNLELGYMTPPMGINLFVATTVFDRPVLEVMRAVIPFLLLMLACLMVIIAFPSLSLALVETAAP